MQRTLLLGILVLSLCSVCTSSAFSSSGTRVYVNPAESHVEVGQTFTIDINVADVAGLQGVDFCLKYDTTILDALEVEEGPFMRNFGPTFIAHTEIMDNYTMFTGRVWLALVIYGEGFADGNGTLATITFNATAPGEGPLDLYSDRPYRADEVKLVTCGPEPIPHTATDGYVIVSNTANNPPNDPPNPPANGEPTSLSPDVNGDGQVDIVDVALVAMVYGSSKGEVAFKPEADLDQNDTIDVLDIAIVAANFGRAV